MLRQTRFAAAEKQLLARFLRTASGFWFGRSAWLVVVLITTVILQLLTQYALNFWNRDFFDAIGRRDREELWTQALRFVPLAAASLTLMILQVRARMTTQITWREWLSNYLYDYWLKDDHYVRLRFAASDHQTPEYGIAAESS